MLIAVEVVRCVLYNYTVFHNDILTQFLPIFDRKYRNQEHHQVHEYRNMFKQKISTDCTNKYVQ